MKRGVCSERRAQHVMNERCLPLVGQRQTSFEKELEAMDVSTVCMASQGCFSLQ